MQEPEITTKTIGRYEIKRQLGAGAMGCVYLAEDPRIKRKLAIKIVKLDAIRNDRDRKEFLARFQREAEVSGVLNDPGIVTIYDVGDSDLGPFLAMEYVPGKPLDAIIKAGELPTMSLRAKLQIACGVAAALDHAHAHNIVHRDVKPGNVIITEEGRPKLMDFGIAKREDASLTQTGTFLGTPSYASPEQIKEGHATLHSDVFSFGVMIFELLSGTLPFPGASINTILYKIVNEPPTEVKPPVVGLLPEAWQRVFSKVLAKNPTDRHASCSAFVRDLLEAVTELDPHTRSEFLGQLRQGAGTVILPTTITQNPDDRLSTGQDKVRRGSKGVLYGGVAAGLAVLGLGFFLFSGKGGEEVRIATDPPGVTLIMNGSPLDGTKPLIMKEGERLQIQKAGFALTEYVHKTGDTAPRIELKPIVSEVTLQTDPSGAEVNLDSRKLEGTTPMVIKDWNQGQLHDLTFTHVAQGAGFSARFEVGETPGDKIYKLLPLNETRPTGEAKTIDPNAPGTIKFAGEYTVRVRANGKDLGDVAKVSLPPGSHTLELANARIFYKESRTVNVGPGQTVPVNLPGLCRLTVSTFPTSGIVVIDGMPTVVESDGSASIPVVKGKHTISIQGRAGSSHAVDVDKDTQELNFKI
jgi:serine/threonine protein kinase